MNARGGGRLVRIMVCAGIAVILAAVSQAQGQVDLLRNGNFESQETLSPWVIETNRGGATIAALNTVGNGAVNHFAVLGGTNSETDSIEQSAIIPAGVSKVTLSFSLRIQATGQDTVPHDFLTVSLKANGAAVALAQYSNADSGEWRTVNVSGLEAYAGALVTLRFTASTDGTRPTQFWLDNVSLATSPSGSAGGYATLSFVSPNYGCAYPAPLGPAITGSGPLALLADAPRGVGRLSVAINGKRTVSTDQAYLYVPVPWSSLPPGESTLTGVLEDKTGATVTTSCSINNTNLLCGGDFETDGAWAWNQGGALGTGLIQDVGADSAHSGTRVAVLGAPGRTAGSLDQLIRLPSNLQDPLVFSFCYRNSTAQGPWRPQALGVHIIEVQSGQDFLAGEVQPSTNGWTPVRMPVSLVQLGLIPGKEYLLRLQVGSGQSSQSASAAAAPASYQVDDVSLMLLPIDPGGGGDPADDEIPDPDEGTFVPGAPDPVPTLVEPHYGRKEGGDKATISGSGFDPANIKVIFRRGTIGANWATGTNCGFQGCTGHNNSDGVANIGAMYPDGSQVTMGPTPECPNCGTPKSHDNAYGKARVIVKNLNSGNKHGLAFKDSAGTIVGFAYGWPAPEVTSVSPVAVSIMGGDTVTVSGANFVETETRQSTVTVGQIPLVLTAASFLDQQPDGTYRTIVGTVATDGWWVKQCPGQTKPGVTGTPLNVKVTNPDGKYGQLKDSIVFVSQIPSITGFSPSSGSSSGGNTLSLYGNNLRRVGAVRFGSNAADCSTIAGTANGISVTVPPGCGNQPITIQTVDDGAATSATTYDYQPTPPGNGSCTSGTTWTCAAGGTRNLTFVFPKGGGSPCDDLYVSQVTVTYLSGASQSDISASASVVNGTTTATVTVALNTNTCPPCSAAGTTTYNYQLSLIVASDSGYAAYGSTPFSTQTLACH